MVVVNMVVEIVVVHHGYEWYSWESLPVTTIVLLLIFTVV